MPKASVVIALWALPCMAGCDGSETTWHRNAAAVSTGPCDIRPLPKLSQSIGVATAETTKFFGDVKTGKTIFRIYLNIFDNPNSGNSIHRLIVFDSHCKYLGLYVTSAADPVRIEGNKVIFETRYPGNVVTFTGDKPPDHTWIDGEPLEFQPPTD